MRGFLARLIRATLFGLLVALAAGALLWAMGSDDWPAIALATGLMTMVLELVRPRAERPSQRRR